MYFLLSDQRKEIYFFQKYKVDFINSDRVDEKSLTVKVDGEKDAE